MRRYHCRAGRPLMMALVFCCLVAAAAADSHGLIGPVLKRPSTATGGYRLPVQNKPPVEELPVPRPELPFVPLREIDLSIFPTAGLLPAKTASEIIGQSVEDIDRPRPWQASTAPFIGVPVLFPAHGGHVPSMRCGLQRFGKKLLFGP